MTRRASAMEDELRPCPFCGAALILHGDWWQHPNGKCLLAGYCVHNTTFSRNRWNTRAMPAATAGETVPALRKVLDGCDRLYAITDREDQREILRMIEDVAKAALHPAAAQEDASYELPSYELDDPDMPREP